MPVKASKPSVHSFLVPVCVCVWLLVVLVRCSTIQTGLVRDKLRTRLAKSFHRHNRMLLNGVYSGLSHWIYIGRYR